MLKFLRKWRQFNPGDPVPASFARGFVDALQHAGAVSVPKVIEVVPPRDKMVRPARVRTK